MSKTVSEYNKIVEYCRFIFKNKNKDYGTSWRILRPSSLTDQIFIKAKRIKTIEKNKTQEIEDSISDEFKGICNYSIMAIIQNKYSEIEDVSEETIDDILSCYDTVFEQARTLMLKKNHDYGEAWRLMRLSSINDLILAKLLRIKEIESKGGETITSEGIDSNYYDIINYSIFALIKLNEPITH